MSDPDEARFRAAMRAFATGVPVIACGAGASRAGCVATALASLSLQPPSLIVSLQRGGSTIARLSQSGCFSVNFLTAAQENVARAFAGGSQAERFAVGDWETGATSAPVLRDALATLECTVEEELERHTHVLVIGRVEAARNGAEAPALLHFRGRYGVI